MVQGEGTLGGTVGLGEGTQGHVLRAGGGSACRQGLLEFGAFLPFNLLTAGCSHQLR